MGNCGGAEKKEVKKEQQKPATHKRDGEFKTGKLDKKEEQRVEKIEEKIAEEAAGTADGEAEVLMISGCQDDQTSADVSDVNGILKAKSAAAVQGAGGACTSSLLHVISEKGLNLNWRELLQQMQGFLKSKDYKQVPQLSSSWQHGMKDKFSIHGGKSGKKYAMLTGINYQGTGAQLDGCTNDVKRMIGHLKEQHGFEATSEYMKVFVDPTEAIPGYSGTPKPPTKENLLGGIEWIIETVKPGDCVFFHYSGHGTQVPDDDGSEEDGKDEALVPLDYSSAKFITDDMIFSLLVSKMPNGSRLFALMDCCHSGTIFDLRYTIKADAKLSDAESIKENYDAHQKQNEKVAKKAARKK